MTGWSTKILYTLLAALLFCVVSQGSCYGQTHTDSNHKNRISVTVTNDNFLPPLQDYYYTNGLNLSYSRLIKNGYLLSGLIPDDRRKTILRFKVGQQIYNPKSIEATAPVGMDRPYAGYLYFKTSLDKFWKRSNSLQFTFNTGIIGPTSGAGHIQKQWHRWYNFLVPKGWQYQIPNMLVFNLGMQYRHSFFLSQYADIIPKIRLRGGTAFNDLSAGARIRLGHINPIDYSAAADSRLGEGGSSTSNSQHEWFFFLGIYNKLVLHNALIEGRLINPRPNTFTKNARPYLLSITGGLEYSLPIASLKLMMKQLSREVVGGKSHNIVSLKIAVRF